ncbi:uncharacterized protein LOC106878238 [Octopus bimaculoides]|uniref:uncharacterized protein LOC106878238 n=1 Tax=Octopus bimaculoides TaxID=37653 RepID=UPI00071DA7DA|nr:uncharacterized protein LOC106878238 [Octopus bimaculoides]XP_052821637.1 uncharacterized protein LOC106878238 [Octopus bimaculoides]|eukprot:XP_014782892.1 PREDICTED: uncharacterized protein LOC106878238 [Octopus bimaculoides]
MMIVTTSQQNSCSNMQKLARRRVRLHLRRLRHREYSKLRTLVPSVANNNKVSKVTVIEEAIKYIDSLHKALVERLQNVRPAGVEAVTEENVKEVVCQMMSFNASTQQCQQKATFNFHSLEKKRKIPSFSQIQRRRSKYL